MTLHTERPITLDEFELIPEREGGYQIEISRGWVVREPPPGATHGNVCSRLLVALSAHVRERRLGRVVTQAGFQLSADPATVREPDIAFVRADRVPAEPPASYWPFAPDLAIEVVSPGNTLSELQQKVIDYFEAGTAEVWVLDARTRAATVYRSLADIAVLRPPQRLEGGRVVADFSLALSQLFEW